MSVIHEVTVYKPNGDLKEVITREQLEKRHWIKFAKEEAEIKEFHTRIKK